MAEDNTNTDPNSKPDPSAPSITTTTVDLGDAGKKALDEERKARRESERQLKALEAQLKELTDKDKSEVDRLREEVAQLTKDRDAEASKALRHEVAMAKGLSAAQAKRLVGATKEELEADADEILEAFPTPTGGTPAPPSSKPSDLKGGTDPTVPLNSTQLEQDLRKALGVA